MERHIYTAVYWLWVASSVDGDGGEALVSDGEVVLLFKSLEVDLSFTLLVQHLAFCGF
jgi:hypothetical protein